MRAGGAMPVRVVIADDNALYHAGLAGLLTHCAQVQVVGEARDASEVVRLVVTHAPDVVLLDVRMPTASVLAAIRGIRRARPAQPICLLAVSEQDAVLVPAVGAGAYGYLSKTSGQEQICTAVQQLAAGGAVVVSSLAAALLEEFARPSPTPDRLSVQECVVLELLARGIPQHEIAEQVAIDVAALPLHLRTVLEKFHRRHGDDDFDDQLGAGVPRRPPPGGLGARTAATPDGDAQRDHRPRLPPLRP